MRKQFNIVCRGSWLSLAQAEIFKKRVQQFYPDVEIEIIIRETAGDRDQSKPLHLVEGRDFFTQDIQDFLKTGAADFAVHSMKDVSSDQFFSESFYALIERDDARDVAIFNSTVIDKLRTGKPVIVGTSSPRRENMATDFLKKALPQYTGPIKIETIPIRGNVDTRLQKLTNSEYDGIILAVAGLNRLMRFEPSKEKIRFLLQDKKLMFLPLFECPPAPGQGAIVAETTLNNPDAIAILKTINDTKLSDAIAKERTYAKSHGAGCFQQFGAIHLDIENISFTYAGGKNKDQVAFSETNFDISLSVDDKEIFSFTDHMKDIFSYKFLGDRLIDGSAKGVFVASHKAAHSNTLLSALKEKKVWAAGTKTWFELAKKGIWVEGCADGLGLEFVQPALFGALSGLSKNDVQIITGQQSLQHWANSGWNVTATYELIPNLPQVLADRLRNADIIFWTSFQQYIACKHLLKKDVQHCCASGKTVELFLQEGITPVIFPGIKSFKEWKQSHTIATVEE